MAAEQPVGSVPRPELAVPLVGGPLGVLLRVFATGEPTLHRARRHTAYLALAAAVLLVVGQVAVVDALQGPATVLAVAIAAFAALRTVSITVLDLRQREFATAWLAETSRTLQVGEFEVVRFSADNQVYDLSNADSTAELLRKADGNARLVLDFAYPPANLERAHRRMREVRIERVSRAGVPAKVRFPQARYGITPSGRTTFWLLGAPAVITAARPGGPAATRAGTGSTDRPA